VIVDDRIEQEASDLAAWLKSLPAPPIAVLDVKASTGEDQSGDPSIFLTVTLPDPDPTNEKWDFKQTWKLRQLVQAEARRRRVHAYVHMSLRPRTVVLGT
jgi:hypothetical protein